MCLWWWHHLAMGSRKQIHLTATIYWKYYPYFSNFFFYKLKIFFKMTAIRLLNNWHIRIYSISYFNCILTLLSFIDFFPFYELISRFMSNQIFRFHRNKVKPSKKIVVNFIYFLLILKICIHHDHEVRSMIVQFYKKSYVYLLWNAQMILT